MPEIDDIEEGQITRMRLSAYERTSAWIWSLTMIFGVVSFFSVIMWLQLKDYKAVSAREEILAVAVLPMDELGTGEPGDPRPLGIGDDAEDPGIEEFYEVDTPQLADAVEAVTDAPSRLRGMLAEVDGNADQMGKGRGLGSIDGGGGGGGRGAADRWSIEYESESFAKYLEQITSFGIEVGFVSKITPQVEIVYNLTSVPQVRLTTKDEERRVYFVHANSKLRGWDLRVAQNAGVKPGGKIMVQFYPTATRQRLAELEAAEASRRQIQTSQIERTVFKVRERGGGFEFYVADVLAK